MKITVVGAGNVGATCADVLAHREVANEIVLVDIKEGLAEGKALDIWQKSPINLYDSRTIGATNDYSKSANSDVVVITSACPHGHGVKTRDIGILMAMGATPRMVNRIFFLQGALIGVIGTALGVLLGLVWCALANAFELIRIPVDIYQISSVPFRLRPLDLALIVGVTLLISFVSTLFPARRAAKVDPVVALKYE